MVDVERDWVIVIGGINGCENLVIPYVVGYPLLYPTTMPTHDIHSNLLNYIVTFFYIFLLIFWLFFSQQVAWLRLSSIEWLLWVLSDWKSPIEWLSSPPCPNCIALWVGFVNKKEISGLCLLPLSFPPPLTIPHPTSSSPDNNSPITSRLLATGGRGSRWLRQATARWRGITERCQDCHNLTHGFHIGLFCMGEKTGKSLKKS